MAAKLGIFGGKTLPCTGIKEENAVRVYLKRQEQELPVAIEGCFVSNEACQNANASVCKMPLRNLVLFGTCSPFQVYMLYVDSQILYFRLSRAARWGIMLVFHLARGGHTDCPRGLPSVAFARGRVGGEAKAAIAMFG